MDQQPKVTEAVNSLYALIKHWTLFGEDKQIDEKEREAFLYCAKQLKDRAGRVRDSICEQEDYQRRAGVAAVLEALRQAEWISRYTLIDDDLKYWTTAQGQERAKRLLDHLWDLPITPAAEIKTLERLCRLVAEAQPDVPHNAGLF